MKKRLNSTTSQTTLRSLYADIRMQRQYIRRRQSINRHTFFLMEGPHDFRRFEKFFDRTNISVIICHGKENVLRILENYQDEGCDDMLAFVDNDFDVIDKCCNQSNDIINSNNHDFDMDVYSSDVIRRYLEEVANTSKVSSEGGCEAVILSLLEALRPLSALRYANVKHQLGYKLSDLQLYTFFDGYTIDTEVMIDEASKGVFNTLEAKKVLRGHILRYSVSEFDLWQFTNGHDLVAALGIGLQRRIGSRSVPQSTRVEVEKHLRLAFDYADFYASGLGEKVSHWGENRGGLGLLKKIA